MGKIKPHFTQKQHKGECMSEHKLLIVEDTEFINNSVKRILERFGYVCDQAFTLEEATSFLTSNTYEYILLDLNLPDGYGYELIQQFNNLTNAKIIVLTAETDIEQREFLFKEGILDYIVKDKYFNDAVSEIHNTINKLKHNFDSTILAVDDSSFLQNHITNILKIRNYNVISSYDAKSALEKLNQTDVNLIILDMELPDMHGLELLRKIKKNKKFLNIPVMILSGHYDAELVRDSFKAGAFDFIQKPFHIEELVLKVDISIEADRKTTTLVAQQELLHKYKKELEQDLDISNKNVTQANKIIQEYQKAIDESNILSRSDTDGIITYVNKKFCKVSGYSESELLGKTHSIVKSEDTPIEIYQELWSTITSGKVWQGKLKNRAKDGSFYYVYSTIVPIINDENEIVEYLAIRQDITHIINTHYEIEETQKELIYRMGDIGESRSKETGFHVKRVAEYSKELARLYGLTQKEIDTLYVSSPMHDIGKVGIPDAILKKPSKLTDEEWVVMQTHSEIGYNVLKNSKRSILQAAAVVAHEHHERWDGTGYPQALKGDAIHIYGRITAVADVFDALGSDRCYKDGWTLEKIIAYFKEEKGKHFDPILVDLLIENLDTFLAIKNKYQAIEDK